MPTTYKGVTVPISTDMADGPAAFVAYTDSLPLSEALAAATVPIGSVVTTIRTAAPANWLLLDGATVVGAVSAYPVLWGIVPASWKHANGTDLILPNARGRVVLGLDPADTAADAIGETGGSKVLVAANLPPHPHAQQGAVTSGTESVFHAHSAASGFGLLGGGAFPGQFNAPAGSNMGLVGTSTETATHTHTTTLSGNTGDGPGTSAPFLPPFIAFNYLLRAA